MYLRRRIILKVFLLFIFVIFTPLIVSQPIVATPNTLQSMVSLANFETGIDSRGVLGSPAGLQIGGPWYAWEQPPSPSSDDINYWDMYSNSNSTDEYAEYHFNISPQDWRKYTKLHIKYYTWSDNGGNGSKIKIFIHDTDGTGNSDLNGFQNYGIYSGSGTQQIVLNLDQMANKDQVDKIIIRVYESFFNGIGIAGTRQRTHFYSFLLERSPEFIGSSFLVDTSCLENNNIKICFDDLLGGAISAIFNKRSAPTKNFVYPTMGGAFQIDFRSIDPLTNTCPGRNPIWGRVWNPTQAGCEQCYLYNNEYYHVASETFNLVKTNSTHSIQFRPRNYYHNNDNDCSPPMPYTSIGALQENLYVTQTTDLSTDYVKIVWSVNNIGNHNHKTSTTYHHELPTFYLEDSISCFKIIYEDINGVIQDNQLPCKTGSYQPVEFRNTWYSIYNPNNLAEEMTIFTKISLSDNTITNGAIRNYFSTQNGNQMTFYSDINISPNLNFTIETYILPYRYDDTMTNGIRVLDFIYEKQRATISGYGRYYGGCASVTGWAMGLNNSSVTSVKIIDNNTLIGDVPANLYWDTTVGYHKFLLIYPFSAGSHKVDVIARDDTTMNYKSLTDTPLNFTCP